MPSTDDLPAQATALLTIDLAAIAANWRFLDVKTGPACETAAVVKADAYGLGMAPVARALLNAGCRSFFLATIDEAVALRRIVGDRRDVTLAVLNGPLPGALGLFLDHDLTPILNDPNQISLWRDGGGGRPAILNIDTGMSRLGLSETDVAALAGHAETLKGLSILFVMSHMACPDTPDHPLNRLQRQKFEHLAAQFPGQRRSLAASSGIFLGADHHYDLIRPGAALYGLNPTPGYPNPMRQVVGLKAKVMQLREIDEGTSVGYGATHIAARTSRIAILGLGYADGYLRAAGNSASVRINGFAAPVVGRVSMDLVCVDVTALPETSVQAGQWAEILGRDYGADDLARESGTIGYEVLTRLSHRLERIYTQ